MSMSGTTAGPHRNEMKREGQPKLPHMWHLTGGAPLETEAELPLQQRPTSRNEKNNIPACRKNALMLFFISVVNCQIDVRRTAGAG